MNGHCKISLFSALVLLLGFTVSLTNAYCCFILDMQSDLLPEKYQGRYARNMSGLDKINDHLYWKKVSGTGDEIVFWDLESDGWAIGDPDQDGPQTCVAYGYSTCPELFRGWSWYDPETKTWNTDKNALLYCYY